MSTPIEFTSPVAGDDPLEWAQTLVSEIDAALTDIPGANIADGSVAKEALASRASVFAVSFQASLASSNLEGVGMVYLPTQDGSSRNYHLLGVTITPCCPSGTLTPTASSSLDVKVVDGASHAVGSTDSVTLNSTNLPAERRPFHTALSREIASGNYVRVDYTASGSPVYDNCIITLWLDTEHVVF
jgi:hypothetical protein